jgi:nicotinamidase-related amidase
MRIVPGSTAMLVVEMQNDLVSPTLAGQRGLSGGIATAVRDRRVLENLAPVLAACRARGVPVLYLTKERHPDVPQPAGARIYRLAGDEPKLVHGTWGAQVVDAVKPEPGDIVLPRFTSLDPSHGSELWPVLERLGARTLIVAGVSTTVAVEGTVRAAANRDYEVVVVEDCCATVGDEWHAFSTTKVMPLFAEVVPSGTVLDALA